ncbi:MAG TPA: cytochrome c oxidase subunit II [Solirubrobacteraceae bacterium]|jgi:cytochrome c oxidase subunit 2|nr:cytochrome c oxidase subunit II [Solirubrobacteraceae bacterium]
MGDTLHAYEHVRGIYFPIAIGVFALVLAALALLLVRGARRRAAPSRTADAPRFEVGYALVLAAVTALLIVITFRSETPIDRVAAHPSLRINVTAAQWSWVFTYPNGARIADVSTWHPTPAFVPVGEEIEFYGRSRDVIHGFWVAQLHFQRQLLPGYDTRFDLRFDTPGRYGGTCSVFCGDQHAQMHFALQAVSPARFEAWMSEHAAQSSSPGAGAPS